MIRNVKTVLAAMIVAPLCGVVSAANERAHHGSTVYLPEVDRVANTQSARSDEQGWFEGRFGRLFGLGVGLYDGIELRPHPSPNYDLRLLGAVDGPMNAGDVEVGEGIAPAGMTFLGQFIDHDITLDVTTTLDEPAIPEQIINHRTVSLDLDCIYGAGPDASPYLYDFPKLVQGDPIGTTGRYDLPRFNGTALIGDPRNDENVVISQLQAAFISFHNSMVDELYAQYGFSGEGGIDDLAHDDKVKLFEEARDHVLHYYHRLLVEDFLPQVIGVQRTIKLANEGRKWYFPEGFYANENAKILLPWMPVEFSVAAYRYGHSQVRFSYSLNSASLDLPLFDENGGLMGFKPIAEEHVINWRYFFPVTGGPASLMQRARKIDTKLPSHLFMLDKVGVVPEGGLGSLAARNLNRGRTYRLPSGQGLAKVMGEKHIAADDATKTTLAIDETPLWYYILQEADHVGTTWDSKYNMIVEVSGSESASDSESVEQVVGDAGLGYKSDKADIPQTEGISAGNILGPVGGTIVGEVIYGLIDHYRERTGKGLDYNVKIPLDTIDTEKYGQRIQMQHILNFAGHLDYDS